MLELIRVNKHCAINMKRWYYLQEPKRCILVKYHHKQGRQNLSSQTGNTQSTPWKWCLVLHPYNALLFAILKISMKGKIFKPRETTNLHDKNESVTDQRAATVPLLYLKSAPSVSSSQDTKLLLKLSMAEHEPSIGNLSEKYEVQLEIYTCPQKDLQL